MWLNSPTVNQVSLLKTDRSSPYLTQLSLDCLVEWRSDMGTRFGWGNECQQTKPPKQFGRMISLLRTDLSMNHLNRLQLSSPSFKLYLWTRSPVQTDPGIKRCYKLHSVQWCLHQEKKCVQQNPKRIVKCRNAEDLLTRACLLWYFEKKHRTQSVFWQAQDCEATRLLRPQVP